MKRCPVDNEIYQDHKKYCRHCGTFLVGDVTTSENGTFKLKSSAEIIDCFMTDRMEIAAIAKMYNLPAEEVTRIIRQFFKGLTKLQISDISKEVDKDLHLG